MRCNKSVNIFLLGLASSMKTDIRTTDVNQQNLMTFAYAFCVTIMVTLSIISNILSIDTFRHISIRSTTVGIYLLIYSCASLFGVLMLESRLFQFIDSLNYISFFIICNLISGLASIFTRICLWLNGLIAFQRSLYSFENNLFLRQIRSKSNASKQILLIIIIVISMHVHELICRVTLPDPVAEGKFVCQINYSTNLLKLNQIFTFFHLLIPFSLHIISTSLIIASVSNRKATLHQTTYCQQWIKQFHKHCHLFLLPFIAIMCTSPQLILSLKYSCVDISLKWLLRLNTSANLILYIPQSITFFIFIYYSKVYFNVFRTQTIFGKYLCCRHPINNQIIPLGIISMHVNHHTLYGSKIPSHNETIEKFKYRQ